ncbi:hypothetical protein RJT34_24188 [Clitoria ternatea]|uniref:JAB1/MPN/MOV34 metalloenzyme domain-containing protein n=1 Tax=Clitoria ternatea TaxID=43366 RepID=A0AAN9IH89_CLITE
MEVIGLMLGEFMDEYTVRVVDVFTMPQSGTGVSIKAVDHVFQSNMLSMLKQTESRELHWLPRMACKILHFSKNTSKNPKHLT